MQKIRFSDIESAAKSLGIDIVGFTDMYDSVEIEKKLALRKEKGFDTEFEHPIEERIAPEKIMDSWKSIISIGVAYDNGNSLAYGGQIPESNTENRQVKDAPTLECAKKGIVGFVSKSAAGLDYHIILKEKMESLVKKLREEQYYEFEHYIGVDTTPLVDREIAHSSGIGFYGRNSCIINKKYGSKIFLGYILVDKEIENTSALDVGVSIDVDTADYNVEKAESEENILPEYRFRECGDCDLCLRACPTGAIKEGREMNSRICLSYLTQTKNEIPYELREKMGKMIYGCDICQNVCPYNRKRKIESLSGIGKVDRISHLEGEELEEHTSDKHSFNIQESNKINLEELIFISNREFKEKYGSTAFSWRGKNILRRNAIIALAKIRTEKAESILIDLLSDGSDMIRKYAIWALYKIDCEKAKEVSEYRDDLKEELERIEGFYAEQKKD